MKTTKAAKGSHFCNEDSAALALMHESQFVESFIVPEKRNRWFEGFQNKKRRSRFLVALADESDLMTGKMHKVQNDAKSPQVIEDLLRRSGAPDKCWVISQYDGIDGRWMSLSDALQVCFGMGLGTVLSCIPGKLCFYEAEMPRMRWLLVQSNQ
jgi:hypothetical protein